MILAIIHEYYSLSLLCHNRKSLSSDIETLLSNVMVSARRECRKSRNRPGRSNKIILN